MVTKTNNRMIDGAAETLPTEQVASSIIVEDALDGREVHRIELTGVDEPTIITAPTVPVKEDIRVKNLKLLGPTSQPSNNNAVLTLGRVDGAIVTGNDIQQAYNSFTLEYGNLPPAGEERRSVKSVVNGNVARGHYLGYEMFSNAFSTLTGNVAASNHPTKGIQHGIRITGYGIDHLGQGHDLRNRGNAYVGNTVNNYANGVSRQTGSYGNITSVAISDATNGMMSTENTTLSDAISASNKFDFAVSDANYGAYWTDAKSEMFSGTVMDCATLGWNSIEGMRGAVSNTYDLNIYRCESGATFDDDHSHIKVVMSEIQTSGVVIEGNYNIIDVVVDQVNLSGSNNAALNIRGSGNSVRVVTYATGSTDWDVIVSGNYNTVDAVGNPVSPQGRVAVTGSSNIIRGICHITAASSASNDYSGVQGWTVTDNFSVTTDANGVVSLGFSGNVPEGITNYHFSASTTEFTNPQILTRKGGNDQVLVTDAQTGAPIANTAIVGRYTYHCYK